MQHKSIAILISLASVCAILFGMTALLFFKKESEHPYQKPPRPHAEIVDVSLTKKSFCSSTIPPTCSYYHCESGFSDTPSIPGGVPLCADGTLPVNMRSTDEQVPCGETGDCLNHPPVGIFNSCAPSDESAVEFHVPLDGGYMQISLWKEGLEYFRNGVAIPISLDGREFEDGQIPRFGQALFCQNVSGECQMNNEVTISLERIAGDGKSYAGYIVVGQETRYFDARYENDGVTCGMQVID